VSGVPGGLAGRHVVIVGAGVAGASLAWAAAAAGAAVTVIDGGRVGVSSLPIALVNPYRGRSGRARPSDLEGARTFWRWAATLEALGLAHGATRSGVLRPASDERQRRAWERLEGVRTVPAGTVGPFRVPHGGFVVDDAGWVDPPSWLRALLVAARAEVHEGVRAQRLEWGPAGPRVVGDGVALDADIVALCIGASAPGNLPVPATQRIAGEIVITPHAAVPHALAGGAYAAPVASGAQEPLLGVGGNHRETGAPPADPQRLLDSLRWVLPSLGHEVAHVWSGVRARGADGEPVARAVAEGIWWVGAFAGRGFLRAASVAEALVARWSRLP
jgi:glycine/D-amino acid oxidase-like deaminating enzyme